MNGGTNMKKIISLVIALVLALGCTAALADLQFGTGGESGTYYGYGTVLAQYISDNTDVKITAVSSGGSAVNIDDLESDTRQLGFVQNDVAYYAVNGVRLFEGAPVENITALAALYIEAVQVVTNNPDIKSIEDLKGKNVSIGAAGSGVYFNAIDFLQVYGLTEDDISAQYLNFQETCDALKDGKIDAGFIVAGAPTPAITELCTTQGARLLSLDADHIAALQDISAAYAETTIPAGTYDGIDEDVTTVGMKATIVANDSVTEDEAYTIVKTIFEGKDEITAGHAKGAELDLEFASTCGIPYNAGAAKYFAEQGIEVETAE